MPISFPLGDSDAATVPQGDDMRALYNRLVTLAPGASAGEDGVDAWLDKERLLPGQDWELEIRKAVRESV